MVKAVRKRMRGECSVAGAGAPGSGAPRIPFLTAFTIDFLRFEGHFCCPVWVLRRDSFWGRVWYGLRTNLRQYLRKNSRGPLDVRRAALTPFLPPGGSIRGDSRCPPLAGFFRVESIALKAISGKNGSK